MVDGRVAGGVSPDDRKKGKVVTGLQSNLVTTHEIINTNGAGMYIVKKTSGGTDVVGFNSASSTIFYNGANQSKTITASMVTKTLYGQTNLYISLDSGINDFFSGNSANTGYINNQPCAVHLSSILITPKYPANA